MSRHLVRRVAPVLVLAIAACGSDDAKPAVVAMEDAAVGVDSGGGDGDGGATIDAPADAPIEKVCSRTVGLIAPLPACSEQTPCKRPAPELKGEILKTASTRPECPAGMKTDESDVGGFRRYACLSSPPSASATSKRPLVIWFHPGGEGAETISETGLVGRAQTFELGAPGDAGFHLAVVQGRNLRFPTLEPRDGRHHDFYHRDIASPSTNPDIAYADSIVDRFVAAGLVDTKRIYVMGWSNGGFFGQLYAIARRNLATPGGSKIAAASVFATANPFDDVRWDPFTDTRRVGGTSCRLATIPASDVPLFLVYRTCDAAVAATPAQAACFATEPGYVTEPWIDEAKAAGLKYTALRLGGRETGGDFDKEASAATAPICTPAECVTLSPGCLCLVNHLIWPDGAYANASSNIDHEVDMLDFLRTHPLP